VKPRRRTKLINRIMATKPTVPNTHGVQDTLDVIRLAHAGFLQVNALLDEGGKINAFRALGLVLALNGPIQAAVEGGKNIPAELANLNKAEFERQLGPELLSFLYDIYRALGPNVAAS
jgi:hypothetical protein